MSNKTLTDEIKEFQKHKKKLIPAIIAVGILGLFLPIIPGVALLFLGFFLLFPRQGENLFNKIRRTIKI